MNVYFSRLRIVDGQLTARARQREQLRRRMVGAFALQYAGRVVRRAHDGRVPDAAFLIEHRIVRVGFAVPDRFVAPVGRRLRRRRAVRRRRARILHGRVERRRGVGLRIENRELVGRELGRAVELAVGVDRRIAAIGAAQVVHVGFVGRPIAHGRDDVALDAARPRRLRMRQLALAQRARSNRRDTSAARRRADSSRTPASGCRPARTECAAPTRRDGSAGSRTRAAACASRAGRSDGSRCTTDS